LGATGPSLTPVAACAGGTSAIGLGLDLIRAGRVDRVIAGGAEAAITRVMLAALVSARAVSARNDEPERASRPFDAGRDGFVMSEGAAMLVLEDLEVARARGARPIAEVAGFGAASDAYHATAPRPDGAGHLAAMQAALDDAAVDPETIDYVNAHGTATVAGDRIEAAALRRLLPAGVPVSSTKSMTGHLYGAAGVLEAAFCALAIRDRILPPTVNCEDPDPACDIAAVSGEAREQPVRAAMSNSFGFGGHDASIVLRRI
jgi:3-oxoacyl-[acyl-carrier-protein] synthase II